MYLRGMTYMAFPRIFPKKYNKERHTGRSLQGLFIYEL